MCPFWLHLFKGGFTLDKIHTQNLPILEVVLYTSDYTYRRESFQYYLPSKCICHKNNYSGT